MGQVTLDNRLVTSPLALELSDGAFRLWVALMLHAGHSNEGIRVHRGLAKMVSGNRAKRLTAELEAAGAVVVDGDWLVVQHQEWYWFLGIPHRSLIPPRVRQMVYERDGFVCTSCLSSDLLSIDHVIPVSKGGSDDPDNLQTLCLPCNTKKGNRHGA